MLQGLHHLLSDARKGKSLQSLSAFESMANAGVEYMVKQVRILPASNPMCENSLTDFVAIYLRSEPPAVAGG